METGSFGLSRLYAAYHHWVMLLLTSTQTAKLQLARQRAQDHPEEDDYQEKIQEIKQE